MPVVRVGMFDMSSLLNTDWNCQFSIQALAALYWIYPPGYFKKIKWPIYMLLINLVIWQLI